jgi:hypothetical protein
MASTRRTAVRLALWKGTALLLEHHCNTLRVPLPFSVKMAASGWLRGLPHDETVCGTDVL